jgi:hypothetical protein
MHQHVLRLYADLTAQRRFESRLVSRSCRISWGVANDETYGSVYHTLLKNTAACTSLLPTYSG